RPHMAAGTSEKCSVAQREPGSDAGGTMAGDSTEQHRWSRRHALKVFAAAGATGLAIAEGGLPGIRSLAGAATGAGQLGPDGAGPLSGPATPLTGKLVFPGSPDYDAARALWDGVFVSYPLVIVFCQNWADVQNAVAWSRQNNVALRPRAGGHSLEGWSS